MAKRGRKRNPEPALAYDYRRYLTLVQVLALGGSDAGIKALCEKWQVEPVWDYSETYAGQPYLNVWATIIALAQHAVNYHRKGDVS